jgi:hypothetical protein
MSTFNINEINTALQMRLTEMNPMKHIDEAYNLVDNTAFNIDVIVKWRRIIKELVQKESEILKNKVFPLGLYPMIAGFPTGFFTYLFDPQKYIPYLTDNEVHPIKLSPRILVKYIDQQQLDPLHRFEEYDKKAPIIVLESPLFNQPFCISGNLKIVEAYKSNKGHLKIYYLLTNEYLHLMYDNLSKGMHMFHMDLQRLIEKNTPPKFEDLYLAKIDTYFTEENV